MGDEQVTVKEAINEIVSLSLNNLLLEVREDNALLAMRDLIALMNGTDKFISVMDKTLAKGEGDLDYVINLGGYDEE